METDSKPIAVNGLEIVEGTAKMYYDTKENVFYNKVQVLNRDLSIQVIKLFSEKLVAERRNRFEEKLIRYNTHNSTGNTVPPPRSPKATISILDALAASGLRSIRYLQEIPLADHVTINDISEAAIKLAEENCVRNQIDLRRVQINLQDATTLMYQHRDPMNQYDVIDLDPYGSAVNFLDSAVQAVVDGGLLCVTCTDMAVLCGTYPEVCFSKYNSMPVKGRYVHESSLRVLLHAIDTTANKYRRHIVPWISLSVDFYVRVFVRVYESAQEVKNSCLRRCMLLQSQQTPTFHLQPIAQCNQKGNYVASGVKNPFEEEDIRQFKLGGPFWSAPIHDQVVVDELLARVKQHDQTATESEKQLYPIPTIKRMTGLLNLMSEELKDVPFFYSLPELASTIKSKVPQQQEFHAAIQNLGYRVSQFHHEPDAVKTDAPNHVIWDIMRAYHQLHPPVEGKQGISEIAKAILAKPITSNVNFTANASLKRPDKSVPRFPPNPGSIFLAHLLNQQVDLFRICTITEAFWGPKRKAGRKKDTDLIESGEIVPESSTTKGEREEPNEKRPRYKR